MRELDDATLEVQLRRVLAEHLGQLPLDLSVEDLERRCLVRERTRRRNRGWLALGVAAAMLLPFGVLVMGQRPFLQAIVEPSTPSTLPTQQRTATVARSAPPPTPASATPAPVLAGNHDDLFVVTRTPSRTMCENLDRYDTDTGARRRVVTCSNGIAVTPDGSRAAVGGDHGLPVVDLVDGHQVALIESGGFTNPIAWSPSGRWLQWATCPSNPTLLTQADLKAPCQIAIGSPGNARQNRIPGPDGRGYFEAQWLRDESHVLVPESQGRLIGNSDGSDLKPLAEDSLLAKGAVSVAGTIYAYLWGPFVAGHTTVIDVWVSALDGSDRRNVTNFERGAFVSGFAWSPDGQTLAVIKAFRNADGGASDRPNELWLVDQGGSMRQVDVPGGIRGPFDAGPSPIRWSSDASRFVIEVGAGAVDKDGAPTAIDTMIVPIADATPVVLHDARRPEWSRDGRSIAFVRTTGVYAPREDGPVPPATIEVANADGSGRHLVIAIPKADLHYFTFEWAAP